MGLGGAGGQLCLGSADTSFLRDHLKNEVRPQGGHLRWPGLEFQGGRSPLPETWAPPPPPSVVIWFIKGHKGPFPQPQGQRESAHCQGPPGLGRGVCLTGGLVLNAHRALEPPPPCPCAPQAPPQTSGAPLLRGLPPTRWAQMNPAVCLFWGGGANLLEQGRFSEQPGVRGRQGEDREGAGALQGLGAGVRDSVCSTAWGGHWAPRLSSRARRSPVRPCSPAGRAPSPGQALPPSEGDRRHLAPGWGHQGAPTCQPTSPLPPTFSPRPAASCPPTDHREAHGGRVLGSGAGGAGALCRVPPTFSLTCLAARTAAQGPPPPGVQSRWAVGPSKTASPTPASPTPHHDHHDLGKPNGSWEPGVGSWPGGGT